MSLSFIDKTHGRQYVQKAMAKFAKKAKEFSEAELLKLEAPVTVTLHKSIGGKKTPLELPPGAGHAVSGQGYTHDDVRALPRVIFESWPGGGVFDVEVTDSQGISMAYDVYFPPAIQHPGMGGPAPVSQPFGGVTMAPTPPDVIHDPHYL
jgi:hypothetical protein